MRRTTAGERFRYFFDNTMARGPIAMIAWLALITVIMVLVAAGVLMLIGTTVGDGPPDFLENFWLSAMHSIDAGTLAGDAGWPLRFVMTIVTIGGIFIVSTLIGVLSSGLEARLDELRKGRSFVIEQDHTLILGWSPKIFTVISELCIAGESDSRPRIVVLADKDKVEMEDEIRAEVDDFKNTRVICRSGSPHSLTDLAIVNPQACKSVIVLAPDGPHGDSQTIKSILALTNDPKRDRKRPYHIVAEIHDERNLEVARMVGKDEVELLLTDDLIARVMVQTCRQSGLSVVYTELMDFDGAEIYMREIPELRGKTFGEALSAFAECTLMGLVLADGSVTLNPPMDTVLNQGDKVIAIAEDDSTLKINLARAPKFVRGENLPRVSAAQGQEKTLLLGWNERAELLVREMDNYVQPGSSLKIVCQHDVSGAVGAAWAPLKNTTVEFVQGDTTSRAVLDSLNVTEFDHILLLCEREHLDPAESDAETLISLLHLRNISEKSGKDLSVVSEMLDGRNRALAEVTKADDFIVSDKMISLLISQISQNKQLMRVFDDLFQADGSEIYLKPAELYAQPGQPVDFYSVLDMARRRGEVALGYRIVAEQFNPDKAYGVVLNPRKSDKIKLSADDRVIVLAED